MTTTPRTETPRCKADIMAFVQGADPALVTDVLADMPPTFFVVGAPRCGTTALSKALAGNPHISFSKPKETHFFMEDRSASPIEDVRRLYLERFHPNLARDSEYIFRSFARLLETNFSQVFSQIPTLVLPQAAEG